MNNFKSILYEVANKSNTQEYDISTINKNKLDTVLSGSKKQLKFKSEVFYYDHSHEGQIPAVQVSMIIGNALIAQWHCEWRGGKWKISNVNRNGNLNITGVLGSDSMYWKNIKKLIIKNLPDYSKI